MESQAILRTRKWIEMCILKMNLCPFAHQIYHDQKLKFINLSPENIQDVLMALNRTITEDLIKPELSTVLLIFEKGFEDFESFLDLIAVSESFLELTALELAFQLVGFHPRYLFENEEVEYPSHYTNRSPLPIIQILRSDELEAAITHYGDTSKIPERNIKLLNEMGIEKVKTIWAQFMD